MKKTPAVLIDDPEVNDQYDLRRVLSGWGHGLAAVIEPTAEQATGDPAPPESSPVSRSPTAPAAVPASKSDSVTTRALKSAPVRYRIEGKGVVSRTFAAAEGPQVLSALGVSPLVLVCFVSYSTSPLVVALAHHEWSRDFLRVGITGVRMDTVYNLARKLIVDGEIAYHEHTRALEKLLCPRLELMLLAHEERRRGAAR